MVCSFLVLFCQALVTGGYWPHKKKGYLLGQKRIKWYVVPTRKRKTGQISFVEKQLTGSTWPLTESSSTFQIQLNSFLSTLLCFSFDTRFPGDWTQLKLYLFRNARFLCLLVGKKLYALAIINFFFFCV